MNRGRRVDNPLVVQGVKGGARDRTGEEGGSGIGDGNGRRYGAASVAVMPAAPAGAASSSSTVTIADLCSCTGPEASSISQTSSTMQAWASWVNGHGGLAGHQVNLVILDDGYSVARALTNAETAVNQDHAVALFDNSDEDPSFASTVQSAHVPVLGGQETDSGYKNSTSPAGTTSTNELGRRHHRQRDWRQEDGCALLRGSRHLRGISPPGRAGRSALWNQLCVHVEHRVRRPQLHGRMPGGQAIRRHRDDGG